MEQGFHHLLHVLHLLIVGMSLCSCSASRILCNVLLFESASDCMSPLPQRGCRPPAVETWISALRTFGEVEESPLSWLSWLTSTVSSMSSCVHDLDALFLPISSEFWVQAPSADSASTAPHRCHGSKRQRRCLGEACSLQRMGSFTKTSATYSSSSKFLNDPMSEQAQNKLTTGFPIQLNFTVSAPDIKATNLRSSGKRELCTVTSSILFSSLSSVPATGSGQVQTFATHSNAVNLMKCVPFQICYLNQLKTETSVSSWNASNFHKSAALGARTNDNDEDPVDEALSWGIGILSAHKFHPSSDIFRNYISFTLTNKINHFDHSWTPGWFFSTRPAIRSLWSSKPKSRWPQPMSKSNSWTNLSQDMSTNMLKDFRHVVDNRNLREDILSKANVSINWRRDYSDLIV